jgi:hypothetical protein
MNNSPFANIINTLATETVANTSSGSYLKSWILILLAILAVIVGLSVWNWNRWATSPWLSDRLTAGTHFWDLLKPAGSLVDPGQMPASSDIQSNAPDMRTVTETDTAQLLEPSISEAKKHKEETWCFIGEDKTGRWCVHVPNSHACDPDRTFASRDACELVTASAMPLGFLKHGGITQTPLSAIPAMSN